MTDDVKQALERIRRLDTESLRDVYCERTFTEVRTLVNVDNCVLADAYLAEHPADEDEPITQEWAESISLESAKSVITGCSWWTLGEVDHRDLYLLFNHRSVWSMHVESDKLRDVATRGEVRRLVEALGAQLKEGKS